MVGTPPTWSARNGEFVFFSSANVVRTYFYNNNLWNYIEYNTGGAVGGVAVAGSDSWIQYASGGTPMLLGANSGLAFRASDNLLRVGSSIVIGTSGTPKGKFPHFYIRSRNPAQVGDVIYIDDVNASSMFRLNTNGQFFFGDTGNASADIILLGQDAGTPSLTFLTISAQPSLHWNLALSASSGIHGVSQIDMYNGGVSDRTKAFMLWVRGDVGGTAREIPCIVFNESNGQTLYSFNQHSIHQRAFQFNPPAYESDQTGIWTVSNAATICIASAPFVTGNSMRTINRSAIWAQEGNVRVSGDASDGTVFNLPVDDTDPTGGGAAATGRIKVLIGGTIRYLAYYN